MSPTSLSPTSLRQLTRFLVTPLAVLGVLA
jgi:hypothetical protein